MNLNVRRIKQPKWSAPMLATLTKQVFSDPAWIYERKLDGMRCILHKNGNNITIWSRNMVLQNDVFPELVAALQKYSSDFIIDCEVVTFVGTKTSFERLGYRMHVRNPQPKLIKKVPVVAYVFDILYLNGYDLSKLPLLLRKKVLKENFKFVKPFKLINYRKANGEKYYSYARKHGWEGIIGKRIDAGYEHKRSKSWLKFKCNQGQEFVIGGFTEPRGERLKFGALLLGYYEDGNFKYAGRVGTGFDSDMLVFLHSQMRFLISKQSPFIDFNDAQDTVWLKPKLIAQVDFTEWTSEGKLRHPTFLGLRTDKSAQQIVRERPWK